MPSQNPAPRSAFSVEFDASPWANIQVCTIGGDAITIPDYSTTESLFLCAEQFLNGFGSEPINTFESDFKSGWLTAGGDPDDVSVTLVGDKISIINDSADDIRVTASVDNLFWGFNDLGQASTPGLDLTATYDWRRATIKNGDDEAIPYMVFQRYAGGVLQNIFRVPTAPYWIQNPITHLRSRTNVDDLDDVSVDTFEDVLNDAMDGTRRVRALIVDGHVVITAPITVSLATTWQSETFRERLGFSGNESPTFTGLSPSNDIVYLRADNPLPGYFAPVHPVIPFPIRKEVTEALRLTDGSYASSHIGSYQDWRLEFKIQGSVTSKDEHLHYHRNFVPFARKGSPIVFYSELGEQRRGLPQHKVSYNQAAYDLLYTAQDDYYRGRMMARVSEDQSDEDDMRWNNNIRQFADKELILSEREGGV